MPVKTPVETPDIIRYKTKTKTKKSISRDNVTAITCYDKENKRTKQIDLLHPHKGVIPHTHHGYLHNENDGKKGAANLTPEEKRIVERVKKKWSNRSGK